MSFTTCLFPSHLLPSHSFGKKNNQVFNYATSLIMSSSLVEWCCLSSRTLAEIVLAEVAERLLVIVFPSLFSSIRAGVNTFAWSVTQKGRPCWNIPHWYWVNVHKEDCIVFWLRSEVGRTMTNVEVKWSDQPRYKKKKKVTLL